LSETTELGIRERHAEALETVWNFAVVGRGTEHLFAALKAYIERHGGKVKYQRLSGYGFHVQEILPRQAPSDMTGLSDRISQVTAEAARSSR
jgi:hypothetical protein